MRFTIGLKIFAAAGVLLALMGIAAAISTWKVRQASNELDAVVRHLMPLSHRIADVQSHLHQQEIILYRLLRSDGASGSTALDVDAQLSDFEDYGRRIDGEIESAAASIVAAQAAISDEDAAAGLDRLALRLEDTEREHQEIHDLVVRAFDARSAGKLEAFDALIETFDRAQAVFDESIATTLSEVLSVSEGAAQQADRHEKVVLQFNLLATAIAIVVGLLFAAVLTRGLVRPMRRLRDGTRAVENGDLSLEIPVTTQDEIADLTKAFNRMIASLRSKDRVQAMFGKFVDPRVVQSLLDDSKGEDGEPGAGEKKLITVFFSDIVGFTAIGEQLSPVGLVRLFNEYFSLASAPIVQRGGVLDKYIGDAVMAFWCAPFVGEDEQASLACQAALDQIGQLEILRARLPDITGLRKGIPKIDIRVGVASGDAVVGSIGSDYAKNYTAMGDTVNLGARLEGANKHYGTRILICARTRAMVGGAFEVREIDSIAVAGKAEPIRIFEPLAPAGGLSDEAAAARDAFEAGLAAYRAGDWRAAESQFESCLAQVPEDGPARVFLKRLERLQQHPPDADWDGVWHLQRK